MERRFRYPIGIQHFPDIIEGSFVYVDKTDYIRRLLSGSKYYFLSRPRRFGKSLFLSTLQAFFEGRKDLFKELAIDSVETVWESRPVIKLTLNTIDPKSECSLYNILDGAFGDYEARYGVAEKTGELAIRFERILRAAYKATGLKAAVLIDEYDAPILATLEDEQLNKSYRDTLRSVFSVLKASDEYIHFAFVTGVSRFSHTSLFSGANNLKDISLDDRYAGICGITEDELRIAFPFAIKELAQVAGITEEDAFRLLKERDDGYHFSEVSPDVYNPFSLLSALDSKKIKDYWFQTGTPAFLLRVLKNDDFYLPLLDCIETLESTLSAKESYVNNPVSLLYEAGYLTIKRYDEEKQSFSLGLPNKEVATSFTYALLPIYSGVSETLCQESFMKMRNAVIDGDAQRFMELLRTFLEGNPYGNTELGQRESYFRNNIYLVLRALGFMPRAEEQTCRSRMDVMLRTRRFIYIFELKTNGSVDRAMAQIDEKGYALPYIDEGRKVIRIAANYSSAVNNIDSWVIE